MRKKKMWRYYCDFCKKSGGSGWHLKRHEERCTMNPNRVCGMCSLVGESQANLQEAMSILPDPQQYEVKDGALDFFFFKGLDEAVEKVMQELRNFVDDCPVCIMAALRQKGIPVTMVKSFNYATESQSELDNYNSAQRENYEYGY